MSSHYPCDDRQSSSSEVVKFPNVFDQVESGDGIVLRLYLVRHGETEANLDSIVAGQSEFPLTVVGVRQSNALCDAIEHVSFDRYFVSDMERARHTAQLIAPSKAFTVEPRLREMGKGAREGLPKALTYEQAVKMRQGESVARSSHVPLLESDMDVWQRVSAWLMEVVRDAMVQERNLSDDASRVCSVLVVAHAGIIRNICSKLVPEQLPATVEVGDMGKDGSTMKHLHVPNTSITVIDVSVRDSNSDLVDLLHHIDKLKSKLQLLTWREHLSDL